MTASDIRESAIGRLSVYIAHSRAVIMSWTRRMLMIPIDLLLSELRNLLGGLNERTGVVVDILEVRLAYKHPNQT